MPNQPPIYDLMLLLSTGTPEDQRAKILADVESAITGSDGSIEHKDGWGTRALSYGINHQGEAAYHLLQFVAPAPLLESLSERLRITDGVLRFRIIKTPAARPGSGASAKTAAGSAQRSDDDSGRSRQPADAGAGQGADAEAAVPASES